MQEQERRRREEEEERREEEKNEKVEPNINRESGSFSMGRDSAQDPTSCRRREGNNMQNIQHQTGPGVRAVLEVDAGLADDDWPWSASVVCRG